MSSKARSDRTPTYFSISLLVLLLSLVFFSTLSSTQVTAHPPFPTIFYGAVYDQNLPASSGVVIGASYNGTPCDSFTIVNEGYFGVISCPGDDPETANKDGASSGETITFTYNGEPVSLLSGDATFTAKSFKFINISHPIPYCGDGLCDQFFENFVNCPFDCQNTSTNTTNNKTNTSNGGGGGGGGAGTGGGGGGGGGGALSSLLSQSPLSLVNLFQGLAPCEEHWACTPWTNCTPLGLHNRSCIDENACGTEDNKPSETGVCQYIATCYDGFQNGDETGVDCGGSCMPCPGCYNGVQDAGEDGVDCGGSCRPCNSCENHIQDWSEEGVDCGGLYCNPCKRVPSIQSPFPICKKEINPLRNDLIFFLLLMLSLIIGRIIFSSYQQRTLKKMKLDDLSRAKEHYRIKRSTMLFVGIVVVLTIILYFYYYYFILCEVSPRYLWWLLFLLLLLPFITYRVIRYFEYNDEEKLRKLERTKNLHLRKLMQLVTIENSILSTLEEELSDEIHTLVQSESLRDLFDEFPDLAMVYRNMVTLYERYRERKNPFIVERDLCDEVYRLEKEKSFISLAEKEPSVRKVYDKLRILYNHYERKQQLYDEIEGEEHKIDKDIHGEKSSKPNPSAPPRSNPQ